MTDLITSIQFSTKAHLIGWQFAADGQWDAAKQIFPEHDTRNLALSCVEEWLAAQATDNVAFEALFETATGERFFFGVRITHLDESSKASVINKLMNGNQNRESLHRIVENIRNTFGGKKLATTAPDYLELGVFDLWHKVKPLVVWRNGNELGSETEVVMPEEMPAMIQKPDDGFPPLHQPQTKPLMLEAAISSAGSACLSDKETRRVDIACRKTDIYQPLQHLLAQNRSPGVARRARGLTRTIMIAEDTDRRIDSDSKRMQEAEAAPRQRKIIHIDMDAFYASVEQRDNPELRGKPVAVGGSRERGVVAAASYEARKFGVRSAMPSVTAKRQCPDLIFVTPRFDAYKAVSLQIREIFAEHTPLIEPLALDEAYLDVTENRKGIETATEIAIAIRARIRAETGLTASAGVSYNKFLAKLASDHRKPDGLFVITPKMGPAFVESLPVGKFHGIGPATMAKMNGLGIQTGLDLRAQPLPFLEQHFGKAGAFYYWIARGVDNRPVLADRVRKSVGAENTFSVDLFSFEDARDALVPIIDRVWRHCESSGTRARTVTLKIKYADFAQITRSHSVRGVIDRRLALEEISLALLKAQYPVTKGIRLLGVSLSALSSAGPVTAEQLTLGL